jgi:hypothetical protein
MEGKVRPENRGVRGKTGMNVASIPDDGAQR